VTSLPLAAFLLLGSAFLFSAGIRIAVYRRAKADFADTRTKLFKAHRAFWVSWRRAMWASLWIAAGAVFLALWVAHDVRDQVHPSPSTEATK
jgi:hypothetical protein